MFIYTFSNHKLFLYLLFACVLNTHAHCLTPTITGLVAFLTDRLEGIVKNGTENCNPS